jgi:ubiquinone/menaquinone biosynthesis C-methylase UbiE
MLPLLLQIYDEGRKILDVGGYDGALAKCFMELTGIIPIIVDLDETGLWKSKRRGLTVVKGSALNLPIEGNSMDLVIALDLIEHLPNPQIGLNEIGRILRPDGKFLITTPIKDRHWDLSPKEMLGLHKNWGHIAPGFSGKELELMFKGAGLYVHSISGYFNKITGDIYYYIYASGKFPLSENKAHRIWEKAVENIEGNLCSEPMEFIIIGSKQIAVNKISAPIIEPEKGIEIFNSVHLKESQIEKLDRGIFRTIPHTSFTITIRGECTHRTDQSGKEKTATVPI